MRLKPIEWTTFRNSKEEYATAYCLGHDLQVTRLVDGEYHWSASLCGACGICKSMQQAKDKCVERMTRLLCDVEDEHEVVAAPRTGLDRDRGDTWSSD